MGAETVVALGGVFLAVALLVGLTTSWILTRSAPEQRRLRALGQRGASTLIVENAQLTDQQAPVIARLSKLVPKNPKESSRLERRLVRAGLRESGAVVLYSLTEIGLPVLLFVTTLLMFGAASGLLPGLFVAVLGYVAPSFYIAHLTARRQKLIRNGLPDALDLLTVSVEAGSGLDQAVAKGADELTVSHPALADEMRRITTEIRAGKPRLEAFRNFYDRTGVDDVKSLVSMLVQTDRFGTSVADALRVHSDTSRSKRRHLAEERAGKVGVKLVFPLVLCLFPALYVVCIGPVVVRFYRAFF